MKGRGQKGHNGKLRTIGGRTPYKSWMLSEVMKLYWRRGNLGYMKELLIIENSNFDMFSMNVLY